MWFWKTIYETGFSKSFRKWDSYLRAFFGLSHLFRLGGWNRVARISADTQRFQMTKTRQKWDSQKFVKLMHHTYVCNSFDKFLVENSSPETEINVHLLKFASKNSWNYIKSWIYFWRVLVIWNHYVCDGLCASEAGFLFKTSCLRTVFECTTHITTFLLDIGCKFDKKSQMRCCVI